MGGSPMTDIECYPFQPFGKCGWGIYVMFGGAQCFMFLEIIVIINYVRAKFKTGWRSSLETMRFWVIAFITYTLASIELIMPLVDGTDMVLAYVNEMAVHLHDFLYLLVAESAIKLMTFVNNTWVPYLDFIRYALNIITFLAFALCFILFAYFPSSEFAQKEILIHLSFAFYLHSAIVLFFIFVCARAFVFSPSFSYLLSRRDSNIMKITLIGVSVAQFVFMVYVYVTMAAFPSALDIWSAMDYDKRRIHYMNINPLLNWFGVHVPFLSLISMIYVLGRANSDEITTEQADYSDYVLTTPLTSLPE